MAHLCKVVFWPWTSWQKSAAGLFDLIFLNAGRGDIGMEGEGVLDNV